MNRKFLEIGDKCYILYRFTSQIDSTFMVGFLKGMRDTKNKKDMLQ